MRLFILLTLAVSALAGEYAVLDNGFRIQADRHETDGETLRLYTEHGQIEVSTASVIAIELVEEAKPAPMAEKPKPERLPEDLVEEAAHRYGLPSGISPQCRVSGVSL